MYKYVLFIYAMIRKTDAFTNKKLKYLVIFSAEQSRDTSRYKLSRNTSSFIQIINWFCFWRSHSGIVSQFYYQLHCSLVGSVVSNSISCLSTSTPTIIPINFPLPLSDLSLTPLNQKKRDRQI